MHKFVRMILSIALVAGMAISAYAVTSEPNPPAGAPATSAPPPERDRPGPNIVNGEILKIDSDNYIIRDTMGKEMRLEVDPGTKIYGSPKVGDQVEAEMSSDRRAAAIKKIK